MGMLTQLWIDKFAQFLGYLRVPGFGDFPKILMELFGFEDPVFIQQSVPSWPWPPWNPF